MPYHNSSQVWQFYIPDHFIDVIISSLNTGSDKWLRIISLADGTTHVGLWIYKWDQNEFFFLHYHTSKP